MSLEKPTGFELKPPAEQAAAYILSQFEQIDRNLWIESLNGKLFVVGAIFEMIGGLGFLGVAAKLISEGKSPEEVLTELLAASGLSLISVATAFVGSGLIKRAINKSQIAKSTLLQTNPSP